jgi:hypothetical protein
VAGLVVSVLLLFAPLLGFVVLQEWCLARSGYDRRRRPPTTVPGHSFGPLASARLRGGGRVGWSNSTWPLVTLTVDESWARMSWSPEVWIRRADVTSVVPVRVLGSRGIRFRSQGGAYDGVIFWTYSPTKALDAFGRFGWPIP